MGAINRRTLTGVAEDRARQPRDCAGAGESVEQIVPKRDALFAAGLFEASEGIAAPPAGGAAGRATDLAFFDVLADITLGSVVVKRDLGALEGPQQLGAASVQALERLVEALKASLGGA